MPRPRPTDPGDGSQRGVLPLVERAQQGDARSFGELFEQNAGWVHGMLRRMLGPRADLEDLVQEVFLRAHRSLPTFRGQSSFSTWLRRIAARVAYDEMRSRARAPMLHLVERPPERSCDPEVERREMLRHLLRVVRALPPKNRVVMLLHDVEGYTLEEIRLVVGARSLGTVKSRLRLARREARRRCERDEVLRGLFRDEGRGGT